jgi:ribosomal protein L37E
MNDNCQYVETAPPNENGKRENTCSVCGFKVVTRSEPANCIRECPGKPSGEPAAAPAKKSGCSSCGKKKALPLTAQELKAKADEIAEKLKKI